MFTASDESLVHYPDYAYLSRRVPFLAFLLIFPIDSVFYMLRTIYDVSVPPVGLPAAIVLLSLYGSKVKPIRQRSQLLLWLFFFFLVSGISCAIFSPFFDYEWVPLYFWYVTSLTLGYHLPRSIETSTRATSICYALAVLCSAACIIVLKDGWSSTGEDFNYLRSASGLFYISLLALVFCKKKWTFFLLFAVTALALFIINSRTWFYLWLAIPVVLLVLSARFSVKHALSFLAIVFVAAKFDILIKYLPSESRVFKLLLNFDSDTSFASRSNLFTQGFDQIIFNPISGYYNGFLTYGGSGSYIHNILSFWHQFGLLSFLLLLTMLGVAVKNVFMAPRGPLSQYAKLALITALIGSAVGKAFVAYDIFFVIGLSIGILMLSDTTTDTGPRVTA